MWRYSGLRGWVAVITFGMSIAACSGDSGEGVVETTTTTTTQVDSTAVETELARLRTEIEELRTALAAADVNDASGTYTITLADFRIEGDLAVPPGTATFELHNEGSSTHNFVISGFDESPDVLAGDVIAWEAGNLPAGTYFVYCSLSDHRNRGMSTRLVVDPTATGGTHEHDTFDYQAMTEAMNASMLAFPEDSAGRGNLPLEARIGPDGAKEFDLTASIIDWEVAPGQVVQAWAYNGMVPGPMIRVQVGDRIRVNVTNGLPMATDLHFHGVALPNEMDGVAPITQPVIEPGETFTYEFVTQEPAVAMYHAHHHGSIQVSNGLLGVFLVGDVDLPLGQVPGGRSVPNDVELAAEIPMVLNDAGVIGLTLNGKSFPATEAYHFNVGDWYLVHYFNQGMQVHPMHQHGYFGLVVAKDGVPLDSPYWVDTLAIAPAERYSVLFHVTAPGTWMWHCHIQAHIDSEDGMFGMVTAIIADEG